jgi:hypothetical protein
MPVIAYIGLLVIMQASVTAIARAQPPVQNATSMGVISGRVTINSRPAPNVPIVLESFDSPASGNRLPRTVTDEKGNYRLTDIPEGRFTVRPFAHSFVIVAEPDIKQGVRTISSDSGLIGLIVTLTRGETMDGLDFELSPGGVITGRVIDAEGRPVVEGTVHCHQVGGSGSVIGSRPWETDDRGVYRIYGLPASNYLISVSVSEGKGRHYRQTFHPAVTDQARATPVKVAMGEEVTSIDIQLGRPEKEHLISGRVVDGATGQPVSGVLIGYKGRGIQGYRQSDSQGRFEIKNCYQGRYILEATTIRSSKEGFYSDPRIVEVIDSDVTELEIKAYRGISVSGVLVIDSTNDPAVLSLLPQLEVTASWPVPEIGTSEPFMPPSGNRASAAIDVGGRFEITGLRPTKIKIAPGNLPEGFNFLRLERDGVPIQDEIILVPGERVTGLRIVLSYGTGSIRGQVKIEGGSLPDKRLWLVKALRADGKEVFFDMIDARGYFWIKGLVEGEYEVIAEADYVEIPGVTPSPYPPPVRKKVVVVNGKETEATLILKLDGKGMEKD